MQEWVEFRRKASDSHATRRLPCFPWAMEMALESCWCKKLCGHYQAGFPGAETACKPLKVFISRINSLKFGIPRNRNCEQCRHQCTKCYLMFWLPDKWCRLRFIFLSFSHYLTLIFLLFRTGHTDQLMQKSSLLHRTVYESVSMVHGQGSNIVPLHPWVTASSDLLSTFSWLADMPTTVRKWPRKIILFWKKWHCFGLILKWNSLCLLNTNSIWSNMMLHLELKFI